MNTLLERFKALPRATRWAVFAGVAIVAYFIIVEPILDARNSIEAAADKAAEKLATARSRSAEIESAANELQAGLPRFGMPLLPGPPKERSDALTRRIAGVLQTHGVRDHTSTVKETPMTAPALAAAMGADYRVDRLITELQFDASPEIFMGVLADLERAPEVATVSRVQIRKATAPAGARGGAPHLLKASISVEAWELVRKGKPR